MTRFTAREMVRAATLGAFVVALAVALSGCGRKGDLDPPPASVVMTPDGKPATGPDGKPLQPDGVPKRRIFLDWLLD